MEFFSFPVQCDLTCMLAVPKDKPRRGCWYALALLWLLTLFSTCSHAIVDGANHHLQTNLTQNQHGILKRKSLLPDTKSTKSLLSDTKSTGYSETKSSLEANHPLQTNLQK